MGCDISTVLQKKIYSNGCSKWATIDYNVISGRDYELFGDLAGVRSMCGLEIGIPGLPEDFVADGHTAMVGPFGESREELIEIGRDPEAYMTMKWVDGPYHKVHQEKYHMGTHSHGSINLQDLINYPTPESSSGLDRYTIEKDSNSVTLRLMDEDEEYDEHRGLRDLQNAFRTLYGSVSGEYEWEGETTMYGPAQYRLVYGFDS